MMRLRIALSLITGSLLIFFQNCSVAPEHFGTESSASVSFGKGCDAQVKRVYYETYYKTFRKTCVGCHDQGGESGRFFAAADFDLAFQTFKTIGRSTVETKALNAGHKPPYTGPQHQPMILAANPKFVQAESEELDCSGGTFVNTTGKSNTAIFTSSTAGNNLSWNRVTFDMRTNVKKVPDTGPIMMEMSIEVRRYKASNGMLMGYEFRNPRAKVLDDGNANTPLPSYRVKGLMVTINDAKMDAFTIFGGIDYSVTQTSDEMIAPGLGFSYVLHGVASTDLFGLRVDAITDANGTAGNNAGPVVGSGTGGGGTVTLPTRVTYTDLMSSNQLLGIFQANCRTCHNAGNPSGGLNIEDFAQASAAAQQTDANKNILMRMSNAMKPMPPTGLLGTTQQQVVQIWMTSGFPQN